jgi:hypothetical protein
VDLLGPLIEDGDYYTSQEGPYWDFKREWPFSYSDDYFSGIARLICAFANTSGGIIIFGVHDEKRTAGHNKTNPNVDKLLKSLGQLLSEPLNLVLKRYDQDLPTHVDVLLVCPIADTALPVRFKRDLCSYKANVIWVRQGHEVISAEPRHAAALYCRSLSQVVDDPPDLGLSGQLPPSPSTIKRFVGRLSTIDRVFQWLKRSDEPRTFLYGKGGSGKTTIAYEIARLLKYEGAKLKVYGDELIDNVIFVSAKQRMLNTGSGKETRFIGLDFSNERELYEAILTLGNWTSTPLPDLNMDSLKKEFKSYLDLTSNFIIIDDIDTLTTKGIEAGFDFIYGSLWRAKRKSRVLYTLRNAPSQSIANSIEVPGLEMGGEYEEFVQVCSAQFQVPPPSPEFRDKTLNVLSERRPLVIESIIALRRNSGNYEMSARLFEQESGDDVRQYVFQREWDVLPADNHARYVLAVLSLYQQPVVFDDLIALTSHLELKFITL